MTLRPATASDDALLRSVYAAARSDELAQVPWREEQKAAFLDLQFETQDAYYRACFDGAEFLVIELDGQGIGRLYRWRDASELRVIDIALLPAWRNQGIGTQLLTDLLADASADGLFVSLHVEVLNPARRLYARLGFMETERGPIYDRLEWPSPVGQPQPKTAS